MQPLIAPVIGSILIMMAGWRSIYAVLLIITIGLLVCVVKWLKETNSQVRQKESLSQILAIIWSVLSNKKFCGHLVIYTFLNMAVIAYYTAMPFWFVTQLHFPEHTYPYLAIFPVTAFFLGSLLSRRLIKRMALEKIIKIVMISEIFFLLISLTLLSVLSVSVGILLLIMSLHSLLAGMLSPPINAVLLGLIKDKAGTVAATISTALYLGLTLLSIFAMNMHIIHSYEMMIFVSAVCVITWFGYFISMSDS